MFTRTEPAPPRLAREGYVPAGPEKRTNRRAMLIPKTGLTNVTTPKLVDYSTIICPAERRALREIVETAEVVRENGHVYLTARVSAATLDSLSTFETSREDLEDGADHELVNEDGDDSDVEPDHDNEFDFPRERQQYVVDRQVDAIVAKAGRAGQ